jgi:hypothetical protein
MLTLHEQFADPFDLAPSRKVEIKDHPSMLFIPRIKPLPMLGSKQLFQTADDGQALSCDIWHLVHDRDERVERLKQQGAKGVWQLRDIEISVLVRLLAKIAHASAVATLGPEGFKPQLVAIISGEMNHAAQLIGELPGESGGLLPSSHYLHGLHQIAVGLHDDGGAQHVLVHLRLFSNLFRGPKIRFSAAWPPYFTPSYAVVAGRVV